MSPKLRFRYYRRSAPASNLPSSPVTTTTFLPADVLPSKRAPLLLVRGSRRLISYASANCRDRRISYSAVCSKQVTLLGNANGADRKPAVSAEPNKHMEC